MSKKYVGRTKLHCICGQDFSTHSSNRTYCHKCKPKCREIHHFNLPAVKPLESIQVPLVVIPPTVEVPV